MFDLTVTMGIEWGGHDKGLSKNCLRIDLVNRNLYDNEEKKFLIIFLDEF